MKRIVLFILLALSFGVYGCGGGGAGSANVPPGENPGVPSLVQLQPVHFIAQTNSSIFLKAKVLDGNGMPVQNIPVIFTNLTPVGELKSVTATASAKKAAGPTVATTDASGIATMRLDSTSSGFATVQAEVNAGAGVVRDKKTVFFSDFDITLPGGPQLPGPTLTLDADGDNDGIFNEANDFILFENASDNQIVARATVLDGNGIPVFSSTVTFGSDSTEATFPLGSTATTDPNGQASVLVQVTPEVLRNLETTMNITALADNGAFNLVTLFLKPVTVDTVTVSANPKSVESGGTSDITAFVTTTAGTPVPDGTTVNFTTTSQGGIEPFAQTTNGFATVEFTAPTFATSANITASVGGKSGSTTVTVVAPPAEPPTLAVSPSTASVSCTSGGVRTFVVTGGTPSYTITSSNPGVTLDKQTIPASGGSFTATVALGSCGTFTAATTTVPIIVTDRDGTAASATITVTNP